MKQMINKSSVDAMQVGASIVDTKIDGFIARKLPSGRVTYGYRYRDHTRTQRWLSLGVHGQSGTTAETARAKAKVLQGSVAAGKDPGAEKQAVREKAEKAKLAGKNTVNAVLDLFIARHVKNLRSAKTVERSLEVYVRPRIGSKSIYELKRRDIVEMLDAIEDADKAVTADRVLAYVRKAFNWYATRDDEFSPPIVRGMARTKPSERARTRALTDDEIYAVSGRH
jgi:Arm DNA-binding domain